MLPPIPATTQEQQVVHNTRVVTPKIWEVLGLAPPPSLFICLGCKKVRDIAIPLFRKKNSSLDYLPNKFVIVRIAEVSKEMVIILIHIRLGGILLQFRLFE